MTIRWAQLSPELEEIRQVTPMEMDNDEFFEWFAGLSSGEATFYSRLKDLPSGKTTVYNEFKIALRVDDKPLLDAIHDRLKIGMVHRIKAVNGAKAQAAFRVIANDELLYGIVPIFDKYSLSSKKAKDFEVWREIVKMCADGDPTDNIRKIAPLVQELKEGRDTNIARQSEIMDTIGKKGGGKSGDTNTPAKDNSSERIYSREDLMRDWG